MTSPADFACSLCGGSAKAPVIRIGSHAVSACSACGLGFLDPPVPQQGEGGVSYDEDFYLSQSAVKDPAEGIRENRTRVRLVRKFKPSGSLLDVGCGLGFFLEAARREGFTATGMEGSDWAMEYVRRQFGIPIRPAPLETTDLPEGSFDVCTLWQVIEHLPDPLAALRKIRDLLRPGGVVIMETRNRRGYDARLLGEKWGGWTLPYHLWHFDPASFRLLLEKSGFRVVKIRIHHSDAVKKALRRIPVLSLLRNPVSYFFAGSNMTIVGEKPS